MSSRAISSAKTRRTNNANIQQPTSVPGAPGNVSNHNQSTAQSNKELSIREAFSLMSNRIKNLENMSTQNIPNDFSFIENEYVKKEEFNNLLANLKTQFSEINKLNLNESNNVQVQNSSTELEDIKNNNTILSSKLQNTSQIMNVKYENLQNRINSLDDMSKSLYKVQTSLQDTIISLQNDIIKSNLLLQQKLLHNDDDDESIIINENINIIPDTENMTIDLIDNLGELLNFGINTEFPLNIQEGMDGMEGMEEVELYPEQLFDDSITSLQEIDDSTREVVEEAEEEPVVEEQVVEEAEEEQVVEEAEEQIVEEAEEQVVEEAEEQVIEEAEEQVVEEAEEQVVEEAEEQVVEEEDTPPPPPSSD